MIYFAKVEDGLTTKFVMSHAAKCGGVWLRNSFVDSGFTASDFSGYHNSHTSLYALSQKQIELIQLMPSGGLVRHPYLRAMSQFRHVMSMRYKHGQIRLDGEYVDNIKDILQPMHKYFYLDGEQIIHHTKCEEGLDHIRNSFPCVTEWSTTYHDHVDTVQRHDVPFSIPPFVLPDWGKRWLQDTYPLDFEYFDYEL